MDEQHRQTVRRAALLVVERVQVIDLQLTGPVRLDLRVEMLVGHVCFRILVLLGPKVRTRR
jgi:hypothetical protein